MTDKKFEVELKNQRRIEEAKEQIKKEKIKENTNKAIKGFLIVIIVFIVLIVGCTALFSSSGNDKSKSSIEKSIYPINSDACYNAQEIVRTKLKAPSTAKFPYCIEPDTVVYNMNDENGKPTVYSMKSYVDSQNSFGAMLRAEYSITIQYNVSARTWRLKRFEWN